MIVLLLSIIQFSCSFCAFGKGFDYSEAMVRVRVGCEVSPKAPVHTGVLREEVTGRGELQPIAPP